MEPILNCGEYASCGALQSEKLITSKIKVDDIIEKGFEALLNNKNEIKILVSSKA